MSSQPTTERDCKNSYGYFSLYGPPADEDGRFYKAGYHTTKFGIVGIAYMSFRRKGSDLHFSLSLSFVWGERRYDHSWESPMPISEKQMKVYANRMAARVAGKNAEAWHTALKADLENRYNRLRKEVTNDLASLYKRITDKNFDK